MKTENEIGVAPHNESSAISSIEQVGNGFEDSVKRRLDFFLKRLNINEEDFHLDPSLISENQRSIDFDSFPECYKTNRRLVKTLAKFLDREVVYSHLSDRLKSFFCQHLLSPRSLLLEYAAELAGKNNAVLAYPGCGPDNEQWLDDITPEKVQKLILNTLSDLGAGVQAETKAKKNGIPVLERLIMSFGELVQSGKVDGSIDILLLSFGGGGSVASIDFTKILKKDSIILSAIPGFIKDGEKFLKFGAVNGLEIFKMRPLPIS